jgi:putative acetyltransferase
MTENQVAIREESNEDIVGVRAVHDSAFGRDAEGRLVDRLRSEGRIVTSVIALHSGLIVASAVFSELTAETASGQIKAVALSPVAVTPAYQRSGFGTSVITYGLRTCAERSYDTVFVLGDPAYYTRFGFSSEVAKTATSPYSKAGAAWMVLELRPLTVSGREVYVCYPDAFSIVD